ncbi:peptide chain release factor N(5)-glutamine methyltransferase [Sphingomicrobium lutaoense]|uniref:Release factor glutamine methyltransferase n=1 Tax=Sphingomicrobium lutaoense TaxID=515949 RepID=A0A839Z2P0_9SPHN|nr:peptide chain release factor N(5)-glutamine methyltransferase [Sphingomicrobium lutaoense]MBB3764890.1 release factor glutamine methyltransferase [Sphingomicrobium lutaoense]
MIGAALAAAAERLDGVADDPRREARMLMAAALGVPLPALGAVSPDDPVPDNFEGLVERRAGGEPMAYVLGERGFWTIDLKVGPGVLIPRPDSETLIEAAVEHFEGGADPDRILDLGTGPGTLLLAALDQFPRARGLGIDASEVALEYARDNAARLGLADRAAFRKGDWAEGVTGSFDLILCNPPYVALADELGPGVREHEPHEALFAGEEGLDDYRRIIPQIGPLLAPEGVALLEIGHTQAEAVRALVEASGTKAFMKKDLAGRPRLIGFTG